MAHCYAVGMGNWALYTPKNTCLRIFHLFMVLRVMRQRRILVQVQGGRLMLPTRDVPLAKNPSMGTAQQRLF